MKWLLTRYSCICTFLGARIERFGKRLFTHGLRTNPHLCKHWEEIDTMFKRISDPMVFVDVPKVGPTDSGGEK